VTLGCLLVVYILSCSLQVLGVVSLKRVSMSLDLIFLSSFTETLHIHTALREMIVSISHRKNDKCVMKDSYDSRTLNIHYFFKKFARVGHSVPSRPGLGTDSRVC